MTEGGAIRCDQIGIEKAGGILVDEGNGVCQTEHGGVLSGMGCVRYNT